MTLEITEGKSGLVFVTCKQDGPKGLLVAGTDLQDALSQVPQALKNLEAAKAAG